MSNEKNIKRPSEVLLWSVAFPGFGQLLNKQYVKGLTFILLEVNINMQGKINVALVHSFYST